jgi:hypothetical protein
MTISYSSYKSDISSFKSEEYNINLNEYFNNFIEKYKEIESEDLKKPIFSQNTKFKKISYNNNKYLKIGKDQDEQKNIWVFSNPTEESVKISILIKSYLNKISNDTYLKISVDFLNDLLLIDNPNLFQILLTEILDKCLFDNKYRILYINLCHKIWNNKQIHYNLVNIINNNNNYYWEYKTIPSKFNGPFTSELNAKNDLFNKINFKKYFLNYIQNLYKNKDLLFDNLNEEEITIKKKKNLLLVELIGILYIEKYINFDIINLIIIDLLHLNNNFKKIEDIEIELLFVLLKLIKDSKDLLEYNNIFSEFTNIITQIIKINDISKRSIFFLSESALILNSFDKEKIIINQNNNIDYSNLFQSYNSINPDQQYDFVYKTIQQYISSTKNNILIVNFLNNIKNLDIIYLIINKLIDNIDDIMLDIPNVNEKLLKLINDINGNHQNKNKIITILKNMNIDDTSDSDSDSDSNSDDSK